MGGFIFMIGLVQGSYWTHRRIWIQEENGKVMMAGHTNKNWYAFNVKWLKWQKRQSSNSRSIGQKTNK
ncbi:cytochrome c biogenesis protein ResB [Halalkalibacter flavus]|uniref:cytochrome c biogenesis protein ResB n=1 Tax=Halalkalibacter flavus TaxID=3090668 RepID=UPI003D67A0FC